jgi:hypothetical protein
MGLYTIDNYYSIEQYNESLQALRNNSVNFKQLIYLRSPYQWFLDLPSSPMLMNYDIADPKVLRFLVRKVQPTTPSDAYNLIRRNDAKQAVAKYIENEPLTEARNSKYALFFNAVSLENLKNISKNLPGTKIWYFGKHLNGRYKVALCTNKMVNNFAPPNSFLLEKDNASLGFKKLGGSEGSQGNQGNDYSKPGFFEADLNYRIFKNKDFLIKYSETPYCLDGRYYPVKFQGTYDDPSAKDIFSF